MYAQLVLQAVDDRLTHVARSVLLASHLAAVAVVILWLVTSLGDSISAWARSNAGALHISEVIRSQHIKTVQRSSEGWRSMSDRGSAPANHYDHVHVTVY